MREQSFKKLDNIVAKGELLRNQFPPFVTTSVSSKRLKKRLYCGTKIKINRIYEKVTGPTVYKTLHMLFHHGGIFEPWGF